MESHREVAVPLWNVANVLTFLRLLLVPVFIWFAVSDGTANRIAAAVIFVVAALTDKLDGHLARSRGLITDLGKLLDPIADKALVIAALAVLSYTGAMPWWITIVIVVRELGITVLRFFMVRRAVMAASKGGKLKTVLQMTAMTGLLFPWSAVVPELAATIMVNASMVVMYAAVVVTVVTGAQYVVDAWRLAKA